MSHGTKTPPQDSSAHGLEAMEAILHRRIGTTPKVTKERFLASFPRVQGASRRLQNATGVRNEEAWPTPSMPAAEVDQVTYAANVAVLDDAIKDCAAFCVSMDRLSERGEMLDGEVQGLEKRQVSRVIKDKKGEEEDRVVKDKGKGKDKQVTDVAIDEVNALEITGHDNQGHGRNRSEMAVSVQKAGMEALPAVPASESTNYGEVGRRNNIEKFNIPVTSIVGLPGMQNSTETAAVDTRWRAGTMSIDTDSSIFQTSISQSRGDQSMVVHTVSEEHSPRKYPRFPDPQSMSGSFTDTICQYMDFTVKPILALTLKDVTPLMHLPSTERCVLLRHFEVGLDGVKALIAGEVVIPESNFWTKNVREDRLGRLGSLKIGRGGYSKELEDHQRRCRHGEGRWMFFGIKFIQSHKQMKKGKGKWGCFGAPLEAVQRFGAMEEEVCVGGENDVPGHFERFLRTNVKLAAGGVPCMDLWEGAKDWDDGVWIDVRKAMANTCLVVNTLYQTKEQKTAASAALLSKPRCSNSFNKIDGSAEVQVKRKRNHSALSETPRQAMCDKKTKSKPLKEDEVNLVQQMLAKHKT